MPANKNALIRYKTIDNCLRNPYRRWTLEDLVDACSDALYEYEGITKGVSVRTVQSDIQMMRSEKLGYNAPIEVYEHKYYRYSDPEFSITAMPLSQNDCDVMQEAVDLLRQLQDFEIFTEMNDLVGRLQDKLAINRGDRKPIIHFDSVPDLKGLKLLTPLYNYIAHKQPLRIMYKSFTARSANEYIMHPYLLKEFRNRWFLFGCVNRGLVLYNLALDRIESIEPVDIPFRQHPDFDANTFFNDVIGVSKNMNNKPRNVKIWATPEQSKYIMTKPLHPSQKLMRENPDGSCLFKMEVVINFELYSVLMSYGPGIKVVYPRMAVAYMRDKFMECCKMYEEVEDDL